MSRVPLMNARITAAADATHARAGAGPLMMVRNILTAIRLDSSSARARASDTEHRLGDKRGATLLPDAEGKGRVPRGGRRIGCPAATSSQRLDSTASVDFRVNDQNGVPARVQDLVADAAEQQ
jgi:hypothetical protein